MTTPVQSTTENDATLGVYLKHITTSCDNCKQHNLEYPLVQVAQFTAMQSLYDSANYQFESMKDVMRQGKLVHSNYNHHDIRNLEVAKLATEQYLIYYALHVANAREENYYKKLEAAKAERREQKRSNGKKKGKNNREILKQIRDVEKKRGENAQHHEMGQELRQQLEASKAKLARFASLDLQDAKNVVKTCVQCVDIFLYVHGYQSPDSSFVTQMKQCETIQALCEQQASGQFPLHEKTNEFNEDVEHEDEDKKQEKRARRLRKTLEISQLEMSVEEVKQRAAEVKACTAEAEARTAEAEADTAKANADTAKAKVQIAEAETHVAQEKVKVARAEADATEEKARTAEANVRIVKAEAEAKKSVADADTAESKSSMAKRVLEKGLSALAAGAATYMYVPFYPNLTSDMFRFTKP